MNKLAISNLEKIRAVLQTNFSDAKMELFATSGGDDHFALTISSSQFKGKTLIQQHQMIYQTLGDMMYNEIHALSITIVE